MIEREREEFFDTRVTNRPEIWGSLRAVIALLDEGEIATAQGIVDAAGITLPTGDLTNGAYDSYGNHYSIPESIVSYPTNLDPDDDVDSKRELGSSGDPLGAATNDGAEIQNQDMEKGKAAAKDGDMVKVKARFSDRGGKGQDIVVTVSKEANVKSMVQMLEAKANVSVLLHRVLEFSHIPNPFKRYPKEE